MTRAHPPKPPHVTAWIDPAGITHTVTTHHDEMEKHLRSLVAMGCPHDVVKAKRAGYYQHAAAPARPAAAVLAELGCPPLALRVIEAAIEELFGGPARREVHLDREALRAVLGSALTVYEEERRRKETPTALACDRCGSPDVLNLCRRCL